MIVDKYGNYVRKFMWQLFDSSLSRNFEKCQVNVQWYKKNQMHAYKMSYECQLHIPQTPPIQLPHKFSYIVAILIHNHFESPNI
jgi:hypothetical protein